MSQNLTQSNFFNQAANLMQSSIFSKPVDLMKSSIFGQSGYLTPKKAYFDQVEKESNEKLKFDLTQLYEFGFVHFNVNK